MKLKTRIIKPSFLLFLSALSALIVFVALCAPVRAEKRMHVATDYMNSPNLALKSDAFADGKSVKAVTDGKLSTSNRAARNNNFAYTVDLRAPTVINTVILKEDGLNVKEFVIETSLDNASYTSVFKSDKIEYLRFCSVNAHVARYVRLTVLKSDELPSIREIEIYNEPPRDSSDFRVTGYVSGSWLGIAENEALSREEKISAVTEDMRLYNVAALTHVFFYCGAGFTENGSVYFGSPEAAPEQRRQKENAVALVTECLRKVNGNLKISLTFGLSTGSPLVASAMDAHLDALIENIITTVDKFGFDGVDVDYEFPITSYEYDTFGAFLIRLKQALTTRSHRKESALLSCAFGTRDVDYPKEVFDALDFINVMTYDIADQDGYHSSFWGCGPQAAVYFEKKGVPRNKINLGLPFYGTQIHALMEQYLYCDVPEYDNYDYYRNVYETPSYLDGSLTPVYFNSPAMIRDKTSYALLSGMGGVMIWHVTLDTRYDSPYSLMRAINDALEIYGGAQ